MRCTHRNPLVLSRHLVWQTYSAVLISKQSWSISQLPSNCEHWILDDNSLFCPSNGSSPMGDFWSLSATNTNGILWIKMKSKSSYLLVLRLQDRGEGIWNISRITSLQMAQEKRYVCSTRMGNFMLLFLDAKIKYTDSLALFWWWMPKTVCCL